MTVVAGMAVSRSPGNKALYFDSSRLSFSQAQIGEKAAHARLATVSLPPPPTTSKRYAR